MLKNLTPEQAWDTYVNNSIKFFVSSFYDEGVTDVKEMCRICANEIPFSYGGLFTADQLKHIEKLLLQHVESVGYDKEDLYTAEELDEMFEKERDAIISLIKKRLW